MPTINENTEPENAYLRTVLRTLEVKIETMLHVLIGPLDTAPSVCVDAVQRECLLVIRAALARPRTNDAAIDALTRRVGDLESRLLDQRILHTEKVTAEFRAEEAVRHREMVSAELAAVRRAIRPRARPAAPGDGAQPDAVYLAELGKQLRGWADQGVCPVRERASEIESELLEIAAGIASISDREGKTVDVAADRERLLYWLCWSVREMTDPDAHRTAAMLDGLLAEFGYNEARVQQTLDMGEPGRRAPESGQPSPTGYCSARRVRLNRDEEDADDCLGGLSHGLSHTDAANPWGHNWRCGLCRRLAGTHLTIWGAIGDTQHAFRQLSINGPTASDVPLCKEEKHDHPAP
jgi:hypothetical protein